MGPPLPPQDDDAAFTRTQHSCSCRRRARRGSGRLPPPARGRGPDGWRAAPRPRPPGGLVRPPAAMTRDEFLVAALLPAAAALLPSPGAAGTFVGGVGGLGKTRPETGVVFRDGAASDELAAELLPPDGTPALLRFAAPWPLLRTSGGVEASCELVTSNKVKGNVIGKLYADRNLSR